jgi:Cu/Ag efflux pump CusA
MVRDRGYVKSIHDLENIVMHSEGGTPAPMGPGTS